MHRASTSCGGGTTILSSRLSFRQFSRISSRQFSHLSLGDFPLHVPRVSRVCPQALKGENLEVDANITDARTSGPLLRVCGYTALIYVWLILNL